jgi:hypothetical protein
MKHSASVVKLALVLSWAAAVILAILPFHAFLTVWLSSLLGHYTLLRLWKEFLLAAVAGGALYVLAVDKTLRQRIWSLWLTKLIAAYFLLLLVCGFAALSQHTVSGKAMWYGLLVDTRFLAFFLAVLTLASCNKWLSEKWQKLLFIPAIAVAAFAILQFLVLPTDFLSHFGYSQSTIFPYETINHNLNHIRVASTLRGANPLGAYLIIPISVLTASFFRTKKGRSDIIMLGSGLVLALIFSFSRSAWLGAALAVLTIAWLASSARYRKQLAWSLAGVVIIGAVLAISLRNNLSFENAVFHTDRKSTIAVSSNQGHSAAFRSAVKDIYHQPLGAGVGTAGPQSVYNHGSTRIAENYFLQIGQEAGVLGMILFIWICVSVGHLLYSQRKDLLALALLGALVGLSFVNLLSHAWSDDTLAYIFWALAAIALSPVILTDRHKRKNAKKIPAAT